MRRVCLAAVLPLTVVSGTAFAQSVAVADGAIERPRMALSSSAPRGFDELSAPHAAVVDVYFGGRLIGTTSVLQEPGKLTFDEPDEVVKLIPDVIAPTEVIAALSGRLDTHAALACGLVARPGCGTLSPAVAGIIFDAGQFRVDIFIAPANLAVHGEESSPYLPVPDAGLSFISNLAGSLNGTTGRRPYYTLQNRSILGFRNARLISDVSQSSAYGFETQILAAEMDVMGLRYRAGLFWSDALTFTGQARVYGASISSQLDTRSGGDAVYAQPLVVFLARSAQVNVYRDGQLLASGLYEAGNQMIDTSSFPSGGYNLTIEVLERGGAPRQEIRFYSKDRSLPPAGHTAFSLTAGTLARDRRAAVPAFDGDAFVQGTLAHRLNPHFALESGALLAGHDYVLEGGAMVLLRGFTGKVAGLVGNDGNHGLIGEINLFDLRNFSANAYVRKTWGPGLGGLTPDNSLGITAVRRVNLLVGDSMQFGGNLGLRLGSVNARLTGFYYSTRDAPSYYAYGPSLDYAWRPLRNVQTTLFADGRRSSEGWDVRLGLRVNFSREGLAVFSEGGGAYRKSGSVEQEGPIGNVLASYSTTGLLDSDVTLAAGYTHELESDRARGEITLDGQYGRLVGQVEHAFDNDDAGTRYSANFATSIVAGGGYATIGGRNIGDSGIVVTLSGDAKDTELDVLVDNAPRARISAGQSVPIFLPAYRSYDVRLMPVAGTPARFDTSSRRVTIYAGNLAALDWTVQKVHAVFGRLVDSTGRPIAGAIINAPRDFVQTDASGYFQAEIARGEELTAHDFSGAECTLAIAPLQAADGLERLGDVICRK